MGATVFSRMCYQPRAKTRWCGRTGLWVLLECGPVDGRDFSRVPVFLCNGDRLCSPRVDSFGGRVTEPSSHKTWDLKDGLCSCARRSPPLPCSPPFASSVLESAT